MNEVACNEPSSFFVEFFYSTHLVCNDVSEEGFSGEEDSRSKIFANGITACYRSLSLEICKQFLWSDNTLAPLHMAFSLCK